MNDRGHYSKSAKSFKKSRIGTGPSMSAEAFQVEGPVWRPMVDGF